MQPCPPLRLRNGASPAMCVCVLYMRVAGLAENQALIKALRPRVVLVEEAAEVFEAHVFACLVPSVEHLMLIGGWAWRCR